ncbi:hypothetical protein MFLAVUS_008980 [Mucor flavus]|uniref:RING-type domain-containing protein n=1 Tax=Mucor flavus TaxID=439312 RepID=A0ABP9Z8M8_9FUNG
MLVDQHLWDPNYPRHNIDNNKIQSVGRAVIHQYKSPYALEYSYTTPPDKLNTLTHCQKCNNPFQQPVTLTCGFTLCISCLPSPSSQCLSFSCLRNHSSDNLKPTILLENILSQLDSEEHDIKSLLDCSICLSTLVDPITTQCGHTFCRECLIRTMTDMDTRSCPFCRTTLSRLGKVNQIISGWIDYLYNHTIEDQTYQQHIPIIQVTGSVTFPTQHCLIQITCDKLSLLNYMVSRPHQRHYAICIFSKLASNEFYEYGIMLEIHGVECIPDIRHSVVQASGLFRLRINQLTVDTDGCYTGNVTRLDDQLKDDFIFEEPKSKRWTMPTNVITTQSTPTTNTTTRKIIRPRPCSMRLSSSAPSNYPYSITDTCPGFVNRKVWANGMNNSKPPSPPPPLHASLKSQTKVSTLSRIDNSISTDSLFYTKLHSFLVQYVLNTGYSVWMMQYEWYLQQPDGLNSAIWWSANLLPLSYNEKIMLLGMDSLRERIMSLILWADKWRSHC